MKQAVLFSGGLDSTIAAHLFSEADLLYIDTQSRYSAKELASFPSVVAGRRLVRLDNLNLSEFERDDAIVPARNAMLLVMASWLYDDIILAATAGDRSTDKDQFFFEKMSEVLTHIYDCHHFPDRRGMPVRCWSPFLNMSKGEMVDAYLAAGHDPKVLSTCVSCYHPTLLHCGECKPCLRKWVALVSRGIDETRWHCDPALSKRWAAIVLDIRSGKGWRCSSEDRDVLMALQLRGVKV